MEKRFRFEVYNSGDMSVGIWPFSDTITLVIESGELPAEEDEFIETFRQFLKDWYDTERVSEANEDPAKFYGVGPFDPDHEPFYDLTGESE